MDTEGRILRCDYDGFALYNIYFPNGGRGEERLRFKLDFYERILEHFEEERAKGTPLVICGDVNTAHKEIDLKNPKQNEKTSGFMPIERAWLDKITSLGYVDTFRHFHPDEVDQYSWWDMRTGARARNAGWRIDYFIVTPDFLPRCRDAYIQMDVTGSDHAPVVLTIR
jgi:exodeoxyribonuclease-3